MFRNYLKTAWRNILRHRNTSLINVFGLAVGFAASIMLYIYISHELSFDRFHENSQQIVRAISHFRGNMDLSLPRGTPDCGSIATEQSPLVINHLNLKNERSRIRIGENTHANIDLLYADASFDEFFQFPVWQGSVRQTLEDPSGIVISRELATRLFGDEDALNQTIEVSKTFVNQETGNHGQTYVVARVGAILDQHKNNSHLQFDGLLSMEGMDRGWRSGMFLDLFTYLMFDQIPSEQDKESIEIMLGNRMNDLLSNQFDIKVELQGLENIHFGTKLSNEYGITGNRELIMAFIALALFILAIAIINFINLVTARSDKRSTEAAIRKVSGASRRDIFMQFLGESLLLSLIALMVAMVIVEIFTTPFASLLGRELQMSQVDNLLLFVRLLLVGLVVGILAGLYPAYAFSRFQPVEILRGKASGGKRNPLLRVVLVVVQFGISSFLMVCITVFILQVNHMKTADLGFDKDHVVSFLGISESLKSSYPSIRAELLQHPGILEVGTSQTLPGTGESGMGMRLNEADADDMPIWEIRIGEGAPEAFGFKLKEGRWWDFDLHDDRIHFVVNETAAKSLGLTQAVGQEVVMMNRTGMIIGVVKDFHYRTLTTRIDPLVLTAYSNIFTSITLRLHPENRADAIAHARTVFQAFDPNYTFSPYYLAAHFERFYAEEENNNKVLGAGSFLAIIIAMLGLLGLSAFMVTSRTKEMGVRKIMGAATLQLMGILFKDLTRWVILANFLAWPVAWIIMSRWLSNYPYRIDMSVWYLVGAGAISVIIAGLTILSHAWQAARTNPVEALRSA